MATAVAALLALWLLLSLVAQLPGKVSRGLRERDPCGLLPSWSFFAPNPARTDSHLLFRHHFDGGEVSPWTEAFVWQPVWHRFLWNPDRRAEKAISDATSSLQRRKGPEGVRLSLAYLLLLDYVSRLPAPPDAIGVQFALMGSWGPEGEREPFVRFVSDTHRLQAAAPAEDHERRAA